jgi:16S rRNA G1207 methylase RsmC
MNGIYLTQESKQEIEAKIAELENYTYATQNIFIEGQNSGMLIILEEILSSATILPVEESWRKCGIVNREDRESVTSDYPNGVIIQPKQ